MGRDVVTAMIVQNSSGEDSYSFGIEIRGSRMGKCG